MKPWNSCEESGMEVQPDFKDMLALFHKRDVEYIIVGAYALAHHGVPRNTGDIDLYIRPTPENARRVVGVLAEFGFSSADLPSASISSPRSQA